MSAAAPPVVTPEARISGILSVPLQAGTLSCTAAVSRRRSTRFRVSR